MTLQELLNIAGYNGVEKPEDITELNLENCDVVSLPAEIGRLINLERLNLSNNWLSELPFEIGSLTGLKHLDLICTHGDETGSESHLLGDWFIFPNGFNAYVEINRKIE